MAVNSHMALPEEFFAHSVFQGLLQHKASTQHTRSQVPTIKSPPLHTGTNSPLLSNHISLQKLQNNEEIFYKDKETFRL